MRTIVAGIAEVATPDPHLRVAVRVAERLGAELHLVHAYRLPDPVLYPYMEAGTFNPEVARSVHEGVIAQLQAAVAELRPGVRVHCRAVPVPADSAIVHTAEEVGAELIVVGATTRGAISRAILGNTAQRVIRAASVPVLVTRAEDDFSLDRVLTTTDLSELSAAVHRRGLDLLRELGMTAAAKLRTLLVVGNDMDAPPALRQDVLANLMERDLGAFVSGLGPLAADTEPRVRTGESAAGIVAEAEEWDADLLLLGTHGRGGMSRFLIGSVAESVLKRAACDLLLIPAAALPGAADAPEPARER